MRNKYPSNKNKQQKQSQTSSIDYLYDEHLTSNHASKKLSAELQSELSDDIHFMRRQLRRNNRKIRDDYYQESLEDAYDPESMRGYRPIHSRRRVTQ